MIPDFSAPIVGVREWRIEAKLMQTGFSLKSLAAADVWRPKEVKKAKCTTRLKTNCGGAPSLYCTCGLHAFYSHYLYRMKGNALEVGGRGIAGIVTGWGRFCEDQWGFRSEYMQLEALIAPKRRLARARSLSTTYSVPLISVDEIDLFIENLDGVVFEGEPPFASSTGEAARVVFLKWREAIAESKERNGEHGQAEKEENKRANKDAEGAA